MGISVFRFKKPARFARMMLQLWLRPGSFTMKLIIQPDEGAAPIIEFIRSARTSLILKQFTFTHPDVLQAVIDAHRSGVAVRVMLNAKRSGGDRANDETFAALEKGGVPVQWSNPDFYVTHEKSMVADGVRAMVATYNLCEKYFTRTRDYGLVLENAAKAAQITECFDADWNRTAWTPGADTGLVWSNSGSRLAIAKFIDSAEESLFVQHPKFGGRCCAGSHRGCRLARCEGSRALRRAPWHQRMRHP
jgi:hypothetical protein